MAHVSAQEKVAEPSQYGKYNRLKVLLKESF